MPRIPGRRRRGARDVRPPLPRRLPGADGWRRRHGHYTTRLAHTKRKAVGAPPKKKPRYVEGAEQKANGKWVNHQILPGHEFDSLNEYRAAKKQRAARREAWRAQAY